MSVVAWESVQNITNRDTAFVRTGGTVDIQNAGTPYSDKCLRVSNTGVFYWPYSDTLLTEFYFSFFLGATSSSDLGEPRLEFYNGIPGSGGTRQFWLQPDGSGVATAQKYVLHLFDATGTLIATSAEYDRTFSGPPHMTHVEVYVDTTTGTVKVWMDDNLEFDETGIDIQAIAGGIDTFRGVGPFNSFTAENIFFSHFVVQDASGTRLGQHRLLSEVPDSEEAVQFTPTGAASNWEALATDDGDTSYNESSTDGHKDRLGFPDPGMARPPFFVGVRATAKQAVAGSSQLKIGIRDGASEDLSASLDIGTAYGTVGYHTTLNPITGSAWEIAELADVEGVYELDLDVPAVRVSLLRMEFLDRLVAPDRPTLAVGTIGKTTLELIGSAFSGPGGTSFVGARFQVADVTDGAYAAPYYDSGTVGSTTDTATGLPADTDIRARVQYLNDVGLWSQWSLDVFATTLAGPEKPVVTIDSTGPDFIELSISPYVPGSSGAAQKTIVYQIADISDPLFLAPIVDYTSTFAEEFEGKTFFGLNLFLNQYIIRVMVTDQLDDFSEWSDTAGPTGLAVTGQFYTPFGERELGFQLRMANWDEVVEVDGESTWTNLTDPDAICLVVSRREIVTGSPDGIDPIRWTGFPDVDKQIVWTRVKFDEVGEGPNPCPSSDPGTSSPNGVICRITEGLEEYDDFSADPIASGDWRVVRDGVGTWAHYPDRGAASHKDGTETVGKHALGYQHVLEDIPDALILWDAIGIVEAGKWFQYRTKIITQAGDHFTGPWTGMALAAQNDDDHYIAYSRHECGLLINKIYNDWFKHTTGATTSIQTFHSADLLFGGKLGYFVGRGKYEYLNGSVVPAGEEGWYGNYELEVTPSFGNRRGFRSEHRVALDADWKDGQIGLAITNCGNTLSPVYTQGQALILFDHAALCRNNLVTVEGLPEGWVLRIGYDTTNFWFDDTPPGQPQELTGDAAGNDKVEDFDGHAAPADFLRLYDNEGSLVEEWYVGDNALGQPGIWKGDVYRINVGGVGVGPIGGISLRTREIAIPADARLTEDDDTRITEAGDIRITE